MFRMIPYITLWARRFEEMATFYRGVPGLPVETDSPGFIQFATEGTKLYIHRYPDAPPLRPNTVEIHFDVPDTDAAYETLRAKGVRFEQAPANMPWGTRQAWFRDPEGYVIDLAGPHKPGEPVVEH